MSVLIPDLKVYEYVSCGLQRTMWERQCTEFYTYTIQKHFHDLGMDSMDSMERERHRLVMSWCRLNELSYCAAYAHHGEKFENLAGFIKKHALTHKVLTPYQLLMYLRCIRYNIEVDTIIEKLGKEKVTLKDKEDYALLNTWIDELVYGIVDNLPAYKECSYAS